MNKIYEKQAPDALGERVKGPFLAWKSLVYRGDHCVQICMGTKIHPGRKATAAPSVWLVTLTTLRKV